MQAVIQNYAGELDDTSTSPFRDLQLSFYFHQYRREDVSQICILADAEGGAVFVLSDGGTQWCYEVGFISILHPGWYQKLIHWSKYNWE